MEKQVVDLGPNVDRDKFDHPKAGTEGESFRYSKAQHCSFVARETS